MRRNLLYGIEVIALATVAVGVGAIFVPAGLIVGGIAAVALVELNT